MHVYILFAHPDKGSFSREVLNTFTRGLGDAGHTFETNDLYATGFNSEMDAADYRREISWSPDAPLPPDVVVEQEKVSRADVLAFIYPVWWSDCPAKLKGWFDRVWTYGFAYYYDTNDQRRTKINLKKAVVLCPAGHTIDHLEETGMAESMRRIMLHDRLLGIGIQTASMVILGGMLPGVNTYREENLKKAYMAGKNL